MSRKVVLESVARCMRFFRRGRHQEPVSPALPRPTHTDYLEGVTLPHILFNLDKSLLTLGRSVDCDLSIPPHDPGAKFISRHHARLERRGERWVILDGSREGKRSTNGIYVNGKRTFENYLSDNDELTFGQSIFRFRTRSNAS